VGLLPPGVAPLTAEPAPRVARYVDVANVAPCAPEVIVGNSVDRCVVASAEAAAAAPDRDACVMGGPPN